MTEQFTIVVSSSDAYEDCWLPFFSLFNKFWPDCDIPMVLVSSAKTFSYPPLNIVCPATGRRNENPLPWGGAVLQALESVETDIILLLMIDYFIKSPVRIGVVDELARLMRSDNLDHIQLRSTNVPGPNHKSHYPLLVERGRRAPYRFCLQAGLWKKEKFKSYIREYETPWLAESWGTRRAWRLNDRFYSLAPEFEREQGTVIDYCHLGGVRQGKWLQAEVVDLFKQNGIELDFSLRGFYNEREDALSLPARIKAKWQRLPYETRSWIGLQFL